LSDRPNYFCRFVAYLRVNGFHLSSPATAC
jgi:hypothetical protein